MSPKWAKKAHFFDISYHVFNRRKFSYFIIKPVDFTMSCRMDHFTESNYCNELDRHPSPSGGYIRWVIVELARCTTALPLTPIGEAHFSCPQLAGYYTSKEQATIPVELIWISARAHLLMNVDRNGVYK